MDNTETLLQSLSVAGIGVVSIAVGSLISRGRRPILIGFSFVVIGSSLASTVLNFPLICVMRFIHGISAGVLVSTGAKVIEETTPSNIIDKGFSASTNLFINFGIMILMLLGIGMPDDTESLRTTNFWTVFYLLPVPF